MKRNKIFKKFMSAGLIAACVLSLAGCGGKGGDGKGTAQGEGTGDGKDFVYVAEFQSIDIENVNTSVLSGDTLYYLDGNYNEETEEYIQQIGKIKIGGTTSEVLPIQFEPNNYVNSIIVEEDGNLLMITNRSEGEGENWKTSSYLKRFSPDGTELFSQDITALGEGIENFYIQGMAKDSQGNIYLQGGESNILILDKEGTKIGEAAVDNWINAMFTMPNGNVAAAYWGNEGGMVINEIDPATKKFGKIYKNLPDSYNGFSAAGENMLLMQGNNKVYAYDIATETSEELVNWINCDVDSDYIRSVSMLEDGRIFAVSVDWSGEKAKTELIYLTKKPASEVTEKEVITLGTMYIDQEVKKCVINFNKTNQKYRIEVKEYGADDWETGRTQLNNEIVSGAGPDIIDLTYGNADLYIAKGILEDLNPFVEADAEIKRENYVEKAFSAYEREGKMYGIVPAFTISTVVGKTSDVGSEPGWTIDDVMALKASKPEGTELFGYGTKDGALRYCCMMSLDSFIDWETGECKFDDGYFEKVLEFANTFPKESQWSEEDDSVPTKIQSGRLLLQEMGISNMETYQMHALMYGEPITFIGFPTNGGTGSYISPATSLGINSKAKSKEGAWEFLRTFLLKDYQENNVRWYFPSLRSALDAQFEAAMEEDYFEDANGEKVKQPKTTWSYDDWEAEIFAATQEEVDAVKNLIEIVDGVMSNNEEVSNIITEEAAAFFEGQKSAKDVADVVQSRVKIYVNENR